MKFSKWLVIAVVVLNVLFTTAVLYVCATGNSVSDALVYSWFAFTGTELWIMAGIKKSKIKNEIKGGQKDEAS